MGFPFVVASFGAEILFSISIENSLSCYISYGIGGGGVFATAIFMVFDAGF